MIFFETLKYSLSPMMVFLNFPFNRFHLNCQIHTHTKKKFILKSDFIFYLDKSK